MVLHARIEANITACKNRSKYYCLYVKKQILLLVRIEANNMLIRREVNNTVMFAYKFSYN
jgi:hypothetical protein